MKILIIGGNGFLGFHLVKKFYQKKYTITVLDKNLDNLDEFKKIKKIRSDFTNNKNLKKAVKNQDYVFHLAGISDLETAISHPLNVIKYNIEGTAKIIQLCKIHKVKRFIYASSIYAISQEGSFYRFSKRAAEDFIIEYSKNYNIDYTILRYGSLYGPKSPKTNSVRQVIEQALKKRKIYYYGSKKNKRKYIYIEDATDCSLLILKKKFRNMIINLTGKKKIGVSKLLKLTADELKIKDKIKYQNKKIIGHYISEPKKIKIINGKNFFKNNPTDLNIGLKRTINYYSNLLDEKKK